MTPICPTGVAYIGITKVGGSSPGAVNEPMTIQPQDNDGIFRIVDCKYMYNLATELPNGCRDLQRVCHHRRHDVHVSQLST